MYLWIESTMGQLVYIMSRIIEHLDAYMLKGLHNDNFTKFGHMFYWDHGPGI